MAVVSGGASGIGAAAAAALTARGVRVAALDLTPDEVAAPAVGIACDVSDDASVRGAVAEAVERFGRIDIVVNNAGIAAQGTVADNEDEEWRRVLDVNVVGMVRLARAALPYLRRSPAAAIVNTCSVFAAMGVPRRVLYPRPRAPSTPDPGDGRRPRPRGHPRQRRRPRCRRHPLDPARWPGPPTRGRSGTR